MYYTKDEVEEVFLKHLKEIEENNYVLLTTYEKFKLYLESEEIAAFFYIKPNENETDFSAVSKSFYKIESNLFTDDAFAIDQFLAAKSGKLISEVLKERKEEQERAKSQITGKELESIKIIYEQSRKKRVDNSRAGRT